MISAPASARPMAMALPIPLVAPVRTAVLPASEKRDNDIADDVQRRGTLGAADLFCATAFQMKITLHHCSLELQFAPKVGMITRSGSSCSSCLSASPAWRAVG
jgi:hypothetical protein